MSSLFIIKLNKYIKAKESSILSKGAHIMILTLLFRIKDAILSIGASWDKLAPDKDTAIDFAHKHINGEPELMKQTKK